MFHKIKDVYPLNGNSLCVHFMEGIIKIYNMEKVFKEISVFKELEKSKEMFDSVIVDPGGYGISWNDDLDISCDELWENGVIASSPFEGLIALSDATRIWGLNESTLRKAISYGKLVAGIDVCKYGKQWVVSMKAMEREYGLPKIIYGSNT